MVRFWVDGIEVFFPYPKIYPEQLAYMRSLKNALDAHGHAVLEMPTGTGKTVALFSFVASYQLARPEVGKLIYCTRTIHEMEKSLLELKEVINYRNAELRKDRLAKNDIAVKTEPGPEASSAVDKYNRTGTWPIIHLNTHLGYFLAFGLCSRRNLCIHPEVSACADRTKIDERCADLMSLWRRVQYEETHQTKAREFTIEFEGTDSNPQRQAPSTSAVERVPDIEEYNSMGLCGYHENMENVWNRTLVPAGVYTLEGLKEHCNNFKNPTNGKPAPICPYFMARRCIEMANIVVLNYQYMIDPKVSESVFSHFSTDKSKQTKSKLPIVVVFDEAHNIDNVCIEALSVELNGETLDQAYTDLAHLEENIRVLREKDEDALLQEYNKLLENLKMDTLDIEGYMSPVLPDDILMKAVPGSIRKAEHFISYLKIIIGYLKKYIKVFEAKSEGPLMFLYRFEHETDILAETMQHTYNRMKSLLNTLKMTSVGDISSLQLVVDFCTLVGTYSAGFIVIVDPYPNGSIYDPLLQFSCLDASIAMRPVLEGFRSVILTSGTISPLEFYPKILNFTPVLTQSLPMSFDRDCLCPIIVSKGANQVQMSTRFDLRTDVTVLRNYGSLLIDFCKHIPDGIVCFFPSYAYMELILSHWYECGILSSIMEHKLIFMETQDAVSTTLALYNYRKACDVGRGAVFMSVCRGKVAEGIDFDRHYGRCVVLVGIPFQYTLSRVLKARLDFMRCNYGISENEFITFDAMRQAAQCVGRIIRNKNDFGLMVFADARYSRIDKRSKLPPWILKNIEPSNLFLSTESAVAVAKAFFRNMAQDYTPNIFTRLDQKMLDDEQNCWLTVQRVLRLRHG
ncbi:DNA repair helicase rad3/xp-D, putative [Theileria equi strain WA]|uniref:DNA 5'-3' helicase n=1 Tax=Theileria equi strain WA TaxID=1537102 RepID=L0AZP5_THEEQ|nr:DNA repair helicase rad3/xp-D, putative [Theileria equi strain WA]AFZ80466.1 DNA repair helicase rad3/xp-D, putative [Theileria equi strain WA]|eukprot:XP_004830132.1 DNA repair helicase rad3/xp-D, putative [Theileria equi strain WA]